MFTPTVSEIGYLVALTFQSLNPSASILSIFQLIPQADRLAISLSNWVTQIKQTAPDTWDSAQFDPSRWDHYALIVVSIGISSWGLWLSWCWNQDQRRSKGKANLTRQSRKG